MDFSKVLEKELDFNGSLEIQQNNRDSHEENIGEYYEILGMEPNNALELRKETNDTLALRSRGETYQKLEKYNEALTDIDIIIH
ncbi:hypothetical protein Glove_213g215 [Diversispora epigaea]|uniref:Uncharacterized protein n=1 Tax=Diversispora epigaea TaxID=1348612 RepID=A0A397IKG4_9GLOM|nr:hypothetical protein Glove_213g215 [Diversispora epigaea]